MYNLEKFNWTNVPNEDWKCTKVKKDFLLLVDNVMNTKSELIFLNKKDDSIPINFNFNKLSLTNQKKITILKKHLLNSHKIITKEFYFQINNNILIFNDNGTIKKFNDISDYMLNEVISYILNNAKISNIEI